MPPKRVTRGRKKADETVDEDFDASGLETSGSETESEIDDSSEEDQSFIDVSFFDTVIWVKHLNFILFK